MKQVINRQFLYKLIVPILLQAPLSVSAVILTTDLEVVTLPNVGNSFQTVNLENTYTNAIPVCTYNLPSLSDVPAAVRINNITSNSFDVSIINPANATTSGPVTPGDVHCFITDEGSYTLPDGMIYEARTIVSTGTSGQQLGWGAAATENVTASLSRTFSNPIVLGQVISSNDAEYSTFWSHGTSQSNPPSSTNISVGKQVGNDSNGRVNETLGYIVAEAGTGTGNINGVDYAIALGADTITGTTAPQSYSLARSYRHGIATHAAMDGGNGGWVVLFGAAPLAGNAIDLAIEEDVDRGHTTENVAYWVFEPVSVSDIAVSIYDGSASYSPGSSPVYTITMTNNGVNDTTDATLTNNAPAGTVINSWTCAAAGGAVCPNGAGAGNISETTTSLPVGGSLTYTVNVDVPSGFSGNLVNTASVTTTNTDNISSNDVATDSNTQSSLIDLEVNNDDGATTYNAGSIVTYNVSVTNNGPSDATNVTTTDTAPTGTVISSWSCTGTSCPNSTGSGNLNETATLLASGDSLVYSVNVDIPAGYNTALTNTASASAAEPDSNSSNNSATDINDYYNDTDGDGILDSIEIGSNPANPTDTDSDGIPDYLESNTIDTDGDGIANVADSDDDGDGLATSDELGSGGMNNPADSDSDGIPDYLVAARISTGLDGGAGSMTFFVWLFALIKIVTQKIIIRKRHIQCSHVSCRYH